MKKPTIVFLLLSLFISLLFTCQSSIAITKQNELEITNNDEEKELLFISLPKELKRTIGRDSITKDKVWILKNKKDLNKTYSIFKDSIKLINSNRILIDLSDLYPLSSGIYFLEFKNKKITINTEPFIINLNDISTLAANLAINNGTIKNNFSFNNSSLSTRKLFKEDESICNLNSFKDKCEENLSKLGNEIKVFISNPSCNIAEEIKAIILESEDSVIGKLFCEYNTICKLDQISTSDKPCKCGSFAQVMKNSLGTLTGACYCPNKNGESYSYSETGNCIKSLNICPSGKASTPNEPCNCTSGAKLVEIKDSKLKESLCECPGNKTYTGESGCKNICKPGQKAVSFNNCECGEGASTDLSFGCVCPLKDGVAQQYSQSGCFFATKTCGTDEISSLIDPCNCKAPAQLIKADPKVSNDFICQCPDNKFYEGKKFGCTDPICKPEQISTSDKPCKCGSFAQVMKNSLGTLTGACYCPNKNSESYSYSETGSCIKSLNICPVGIASTPNKPCNCSSPAKLTEIKDSKLKESICECSGGKTYAGKSGCKNICKPEQKAVSFNNCECAEGASTDLSFGCVCPLKDGVAQQYSQFGCFFATKTCGIDEISSLTDPCNCKDPAKLVPVVGKANSFSCQCPNGGSYKGKEGCTNSANICETGQVSTNDKPCTCADGAQLSDFNGACFCAAGFTYTTKGCTENKLCQQNEKVVENKCNCIEPAFVNEIGLCDCEPGQIYTDNNGCINPGIPICKNGQKATKENLCVCANGAAFNENTICFCLVGKNYSENGCSP